METRDAYHEALDQLLDAADADGQVIDIGSLAMTFPFEDEKPAADDPHQVVSVFHAKVAGGNIGDMFVERRHTIGGISRPEMTKRLRIEKTD